MKKLSLILLPLLMAIYVVSCKNQENKNTIDLAQYMGYRMSEIKKIFKYGTYPERFIAETAVYDLGWAEFAYAVPTTAERVYSITMRRKNESYSLLGVTISMKKSKATAVLKKAGWKIVNYSGSTIQLSKTKKMTDTSKICVIEVRNSRVYKIKYTDNKLR